MLHSKLSLEKERIVKRVIIKDTCYLCYYYYCFILYLFPEIISSFVPCTILYYKCW